MYKKIFFISFVIFLIFNLSLSKAQNLTNQEKQWLAKAQSYEKNGWLFLHIEGAPFERGFQRGYLSANLIDEFFKTISFLEKFETAKEISFFVDAATKLFENKVPEEYVKEMQGMVAGMKKAGKLITYEQMLFMNGFIDILWHWYPQELEKMREPEPGCSAFIATGDVTADGKIVMAHNSWYFYTILRFCNQIIEIVPEKGNRILMQSWGPCLYSGTDFFITSGGLMGAETTIGAFSGFDSSGTPVFVRARKAMQYAKSIDQWAEIMIENNNGAYANSWLLGDNKTNEIGRLELGLKNYSLEKKKNGYFTGSNIVDDVNILREETVAVYDDVRDFCVSRRVRWNQMMKKNFGKVDVEIAKKMLADHYDVYLGKEEPSFRTICGHWELDNGMVPGTMGAFLPGGAVDGKVVDSKMVKNWQLWAKWGSSCDIGFNAKEFLEKHPQYEWQKDYLVDMEAEPWTVFPVEGKK